MAFSAHRPVNRSYSLPISLLLLLLSLQISAQAQESAIAKNSESDSSTVISTARLADTDLDGVVDSIDACPDTPALIIVNKFGCPDTNRMMATRALPGLFPPGGTTLEFADPTQLDSIVAFMQYLDNVTLFIFGHTDDIGIDERNLRVSQERADAVQKYIVSKGISEDRVFSIGKGETEPVASNRTRKGRRLNRRIELVFRN